MDLLCLSICLSVKMNLQFGYRQIAYANTSQQWQYNVTHE